MEHPEERYYKLSRFLLSVNGLSPYQNIWNARLIRIIIILIFLSSIFVQISSVLTSKVTLEFIVDIISAFLPTFGAIVHLCARIPHVDKYRKLLEHMWSDWALHKTKNEMKIMHDYAETTRLVMLVYMLQVYMCAVMYNVWMYMPEILNVVWPLNESRPRVQSFNVEFFIDEDRYIYLIRSHICIVFIAMANIFLNNFSLLLIFTQHVCGMCKLLGYRAERLFRVIENSAGCDLIRGMELNYGNTAVFVRLHYNVIEFIKIIEACHRIPFLWDLLAMIITLSLTLIQMLTISGNIERAIRSIGLIFCILIYSFIINHMGQKITDGSSSICEKVYNSAWYNVAVSEQKSLLFIMNRRFHPLVLTANKFYTMSLQNFEMIFQTAVSYCMFIRQI